MRLPVKYVKEGNNLDNYFDGRFVFVADASTVKSCGYSNRFTQNSNPKTDAYGKVTRHH
jgi:hypothetical protein